HTFVTHYYYHSTIIYFFLIIRPPPTSTLFPYTTLFRSATKSNQIKQLIRNGRSASLQRTFKKSFTSFSHSTRYKTRDGLIRVRKDRKSGSAGMPRPISYAVFCLKKKNKYENEIKRPQQGARSLDRNS